MLEIVHALCMQQLSLFIKCLLIAIAVHTISAHASSAISAHTSSAHPRPSLATSSSIQLCILHSAGCTVYPFGVLSPFCVVVLDHFFITVTMGGENRRVLGPQERF